MDGDTDDGQVEVVKEDRYVVVEALGGTQVQLEAALTDALQLVLALGAATTHATPSTHSQLHVPPNTPTYHDLLELSLKCNLANVQNK